MAEGLDLVFRHDEDSDEDFLGQTEEDFLDLIQANYDDSDSESGSQEFLESSQEIEESQGEVDPKAWLPEFNEVCGPKRGNFDSPVDVFNQFYNDELMENIATEINRYAQECIQSKGDLSTHSRFRMWTPTTVEELRAFMALQMAMGMCKQPTIQDYWSDWWLTKTPSFPTVMSRNRFQLISGFQHFVDNSNFIPRDEPGYDPLFKIRPLFEQLVPKFQEQYTPGQELTVDEMIISWKGRLSFKQYMPMKPVKWGVKSWVLAESKTGYVMDMDFYTGKTQHGPVRDLGKKVVLDLLEGYENRGYIVFTDRFFSSPSLFHALEEKNIGACGTVNHTRKGINLNCSYIHTKCYFITKFIPDMSLCFFSGNY